MSLIIENLKKDFGDFSLSLDLRAEAGELLVLVGPSGSGKSTSLLLLGGMIPPDSGSLRLMGRDITKEPPEKRNIGIVFQDYALFPHMTVFGNIAYGLKTRGWKKERVQNRVEELLSLVRLSGFGKRIIGELSGGEKQRVALARALAPEPSLLLLDEPLSALDESLRESMRREIQRIQKSLKITTLYVTHDQREALAIGDMIALLNRGSVVETGTPEEIYRAPKDLFSARFIGGGNLLPEKGGQIFFRPEDAFPVRQGEKSDYSGRVIYSEFQGSHYEAEILYGERVVRFRTFEVPPPLGDNIGIKIRSGRVRFFPD